MTPHEQRQANSTKAWKATTDRLCNLAPQGFFTTPAIEDLERAAESASLAYIAGDPGAGASAALAKWEAAVVEAITKQKPEERACQICGLEKVVTLVGDDGDRTCAGCYRGVRWPKPVPGASTTTKETNGKNRG